MKSLKNCLFLLTLSAKPVFLLIKFLTGSHNAKSFHLNWDVEFAEVRKNIRQGRQLLYKMRGLNSSAKSFLWSLPNCLISSRSSTSQNRIRQRESHFISVWYKRTVCLFPISSQKDWKSAWLKARPKFLTPGNPRDPSNLSFLNFTV